MKKSILIISLLVFAFAAYAQNTALIRERGYKAINSQNTREVSINRSAAQKVVIW